MIRVIVAAILLATAGAAYAQFNRCGFGPCPAGINSMGPTSPGGSIPPPAANFRVTNTGDFRVTSTGDSRVISP